MRKHIERATPHLMIVSMSVGAIMLAPSYASLGPAFVAGMWFAILLVERAWKDGA